METVQRPYLKPLAQRGYVQGVTISSKSSNRPLCHFFGGLRYALPPPERWRKAWPLPQSYSYGTIHRPYECPGSTGVCPQDTFLDLSASGDCDEDCFQCNVWVPTGEPPKDGWPVLFFIHGGFLQFGTPNYFFAAALIGETDFNAIIVMPAYRLGVFGFLYSSELEKDAASANETVGNHGFCDQRMALEWTKDNISLFGGNASEITLAGYSAGAFSVCYQLSYDLTLPPSQAIIKRACIWSNSFTVQPKPPSLAQTQFDQLLCALDISLSLPADQKLARLRSIPQSTLLRAGASIPLHEFRPTTDNTFIPASLFQTLDNGLFASRLLARNLPLLVGECRDEHFLYGTYRPPEQDSLESLRHRLMADYPGPIVDALIRTYYPTGHLPRDCKNWSSDAFGRIYADMQVHNMQRGFLYALTNPTTTSSSSSTHDNTVGKAVEKLLYRYRMEYRVKAADKSAPPGWGVTHATDQYIWFWGNGEVIEEDEKPVIKRAVIDPFIKFVHGRRDLEWGTGNAREVRTLKPDGSVEIWEDGLWDRAVRVWKALREVGDYAYDS